MKSSFFSSSFETLLPCPKVLHCLLQLNINISFFLYPLQWGVVHNGDRRSFILLSGWPEDDKITFQCCFGYSEILQGKTLGFLKLKKLVWSGVSSSKNCRLTALVFCWSDYGKRKYFEKIVPRHIKKKKCERQEKDNFFQSHILNIGSASLEISN